MEKIRVLISAFKLRKNSKMENSEMDFNYVHNFVVRQNIFNILFSFTYNNSLLYY